MPLNINLDVNPYFDDYNANNQYYRVLFKPAIAVQARELTTLQSMLQNQIEQFGNWAFQNGDIVSGCVITDIPSLAYVRLADINSNGQTYDVVNFVNNQIVSLQSNLTARGVYAVNGLSSNYPATNILYVIYTNTGTGGQQIFSNTDQLSIINIASQTTMMTVNTYLSNSSTTTVGNAHAISVGSGIAFLNGIFVNVLQPTIGLVNAYGTAAGNSVVGFVLQDNIITADQDPSLYDNALGYGNINAPGADRLQLQAGLLTLATPNAIANTTGFNPIATYNYGSLVSTSNANNDLYSIVGSAIAQRVYDESGNFVINPFAITTLTYSNSIVSTANSQTALLAVAPGSGYAQGNSVQILKTAYVNIRRGIDTTSYTQQNITFNYGGYFVLQEVSGTFNPTLEGTVTFYNQPQQSITNHTYNTLTPVGTAIGTANIKCFTYLTGPIGSNVAYYALHVFNVNMYSGYNINQVQSVYSTSGTVKGVGDINPVTSGLINTAGDDQLYSFGVGGLQSLRSNTGSNVTEFTYRQQSTLTTSTSGNTVTCSYTLPTGNDELTFGVGQVPDVDAAQFTIINTSNAQSSALNGTVTVYNTNNYVLGSGTYFNNAFSPYSQILVGSTIRTVTQVINSTAMTVDTPFAANASGATFYRYYPAGKIWNISSTATDIPSYMNVTNSTNFSISLTFNGNTLPSTSLTTAAVYNVLRTTAVPASKIINKNRYVTINTSANPNGPWCLGYPDIHQITAVYSCTSPNYTTSNPNVTGNFVFDSGASDSSYGLGYLYPTTPVAPNTYLLVQLDYFSVNTTPGYGFFTVESYPIDDVNTANLNAITTYNIPTYVDQSGNHVWLRDYVDFRTPVVITANDTGPCNLANQAQVTTAITYATNNPANTVTYLTPLVNPAWGQNFQADITTYLPRTDLLYMTPDSQLHIKEGVSAVYPQAPLYPDSAMAISLINVPTYPSLTGDQLNIVAAENSTSKNVIRNTNNFITTNLVTNRRYTMQDIGTLDSRITNLEAYTALNLLQQNTQNITVTNSLGLDQFKNGIFADPLNDFTYCAVSDPAFSMAIDVNTGGGRPKIIRENVKLLFNSGLSSTVQQTGRAITLPYTEQQFIIQPYATAYRSAALVAFSWQGTLTLLPTYDNQVDTTTTAAAQITINTATAWQQFANSPFGTIYGDWRTTTSTVSKTVVSGTSTPTAAATTSAASSAKGGWFTVSKNSGFPGAPADTLTSGVAMVYLTF